MLGKNIDGSINWNELDNMKGEDEMNENNKNSYWQRWCKEEIDCLDEATYREQECRTAIALWLQGDYSFAQEILIKKWIDTPEWNFFMKPRPINGQDEF